MSWRLTFDTHTHTHTHFQLRKQTYMAIYVLLLQHDRHRLRCHSDRRRRSPPKSPDVRRAAWCQPLSHQVPDSFTPEPWLSGVSGVSGGCRGLSGAAGGLSGVCRLDTPDSMCRALSALPGAAGAAGAATMIRRCRGCRVLCHIQLYNNSISLHLQHLSQATVHAYHWHIWHIHTSAHGMALVSCMCMVS